MRRAASITTARPEPRAGPGLAISLIATGVTAYVSAIFLGLLALALLVMFPQLRTAVPSGMTEGAFVVTQVLVLIAAAWVGMRRERLHGGLAFLTVASLYGGIGLGLALVLSVGGWVAALVALGVMAAWCWIDGSHGTPWYDREEASEA